MSGPWRGIVRVGGSGRRRRLHAIRRVREFGKDVLCVVDGFFQRNLDDFYTIESFKTLDLNVNSEDGDLCLANVVFGELVLDPDRALCLDFYLVPATSGYLLKTRGSHIRMSDSCWAGGDCDNLHRSVLPSVGLPDVLVRTSWKYQRHSEAVSQET